MRPPLLSRDTDFHQINHSKEHGDSVTSVLTSSVRNSHHKEYRPRHILSRTSAPRQRLPNNLRAHKLWELQHNIV